MSFLLSGLARLIVQPTVGFKNAEIDLHESFTLKSGQLIVRLTPPQAGEVGDEISMFTKIPQSGIKSRSYMAQQT